MIGELVVVGDTGVDLMVAAPRLPEVGGKAIGVGLGIFPGGMGANFASAARRHDGALPIRLISRVGDDDFGRASVAALKAAGIATDAVEILPGETTWWCAVAIDPAGEKALLGGRSAASLPDARDIHGDVVAAAAWVHILGDIAGSERLIDLAREAGVTVSVDIEGSFAIDEPERAAELARLADLVILNTASLIELTGDGDPISAVSALLEHRQSGTVLVTRGADGSLYAEKRRHEAVDIAIASAAVIDRVVDTTGAGDAFAGTFVAARLRGTEVPAALKAAAAAAASTLRHYGARPGGLPGWPTTPQEETA